MTDEPLPPDLEVDLPLPDGLKVTNERPYQILLVSDLAGSEKGTLSGPLEGGVAEVNAETLDALLAGARPTVRFTTTDPVAGGNAMIEIALRFDSLKAFQPKTVLQQIPATKALLGARDEIVGRLRGRKPAVQLTEAVQRAAAADAALAWLPQSLKWTPSAAPPPADVVDNLLGQLDLGEESPASAGPPPKSPIGAVVSAAAARGATQLPPEEVSALRRTMAEIDRRAGAWLNMLLHTPAVQRVEASWRALAFLVSHIDFRRGVRLSVLHTPPAALTERLRTLVIDPVFDQGAAAPELILVDTQFGNSAADIEVLDELAQHAASLPAVLLAGLSAEFFGVKNAWQVPTLPPLVSLLDQWQYAKWKTLRGQPYARMLGVIFGRCLLREPYAGDGAEQEFAFKEDCLSDKDFLWTSGVIAAGCTVAHSVAKLHWPTGLVGRLDGFASSQGGPKGDKRFGPADTQMPVEKAQDLAVGGINAVISLRDRPEVLVCNGFSAGRPARPEGAALLEVSLPYQLFASRLSNLLLELKPHLAGLAQDKLTAFVLTHVRDWLKVEGIEPEEQQAAVQVRPAEGQPGALQLAVTVTPPPPLLPGGIPVVVGYVVK